MKVRLAVIGGENKVEISEASRKKCDYIVGLLGAVEGESEYCDVEVPEANPRLLVFTRDFLLQHENDPPLEGENPKHTMTDWDREEFGKIWKSDGKDTATNMEIVALLKMANFLGCQHLLQCAAIHMGTLLVTKNEKEVQEWFGRFREFTKEEEEAVRAKYPLPF